MPDLSSVTETARVAASVLAACTAIGWLYDQASSTLQIVRKPAPDAQREGFSNLQQITEYMVHLEQ